MDNSIAIEKAKQYKGLGRFSPWIFEPNHNKNVGQKTSIMSGVPEPVRNRNGVERTIKQEVSSETLDLNQRLSSNINKTPDNNPTSMLGSLML